MRPGLLARISIRAIARYRRWGAGRGAGSCRFHPSCSTFALDAFRTRAFLVALWLVAWRLLRCNPLVRAGSNDPVSRRRRWHTRPGTVGTLSSLLAMSGLLVLLVAAVASAQGVTGGCSANINGRDPATMTRKDPLVVSKGQVVSVRGQVPASVQEVPEDQVQSTTVIVVSIVEGVADVKSESHPGQGYAWGGQVSVDDYLKWGVGLYKVEGRASGTPGWSCAGSGYVKLDGNPLSKPIGQAAAGTAAVGAVGAIASALPKRRPGVEAPPTAEHIKGEFARDAEQVLGIAPTREPILDTGVSLGCGVLIVLFLLGFGPFGPFAAVAIPGQGPRRVWARGRPVLGFFAGLLLGIGLAVLLQQYGFWPLTTVTAIVFPAFVAVLTSVRARLGRPYRIGQRSADPT